MRWKRKGVWECMSLPRGLHLYLNDQGVSPPASGATAPYSCLTASGRLPSVTPKERWGPQGSRYMCTQVFAHPGDHASLITPLVMFESWDPRVPKYRQGRRCQSGGTVHPPVSLCLRLSTQGSLSSPSPDLPLSSLWDSPPSLAVAAEWRPSLSPSGSMAPERAGKE